MADILVHADPHAHADHHDEHIDPGPARFVLTSGIQMLLLGGVGLGVLCLVLSAFVGTGDLGMTRFWSNWLHNSVFFMGVAFMSLFLIAAKVLMYSGWHTVFKRVWEAYAQFLPVALLLILPIVLGVWLGWHHLYHWSDAEAVANDELLASKANFLNPIWYTVAAIGIVAVWYFVFAVPLRRASIEEDERGSSAYEQHLRMRRTAGIFLPIAAFSSAAVIWQMVMSVDAHWYSTLFAWYATASWLVAAVGLTILLLIFLKTLGYFGQVTADHLHDLGKYMFAFSIFWSYLWFSQFMLIWYGNIGEETVYFQTRMSEFPVLFWANLALNFVLPFFVLMPNITKRMYGPLAFVSIMVVFGHWLDYFQMLKPGILETAVHAAHGGNEDDHFSEANAASVTGDHHTGLSTSEYTTPSAHSGAAGMTGTDGEQDDAALTEEGTDGDVDQIPATEGEGGTDAADSSSEEGAAEMHQHDGLVEHDATEAHDGASHQDDGMADEASESHGATGTGETGAVEHAAAGHENGEAHAAGGEHGGDSHAEVASYAGFHVPGLIEIGTFIGFLSLFFLVALRALAKANLVPYNDPYLEESLHHHV